MVLDDVGAGLMVERCALCGPAWDNFALLVDRLHSLRAVYLDLVKLIQEFDVASEDLRLKALSVEELFKVAACETREQSFRLILRTLIIGGAEL